MTAMSIFAAGISGVFCGMGLIYLSIKATALAADHLFGERPES